MTMTNSEPQGLRCPFEDPDGPPPDLTRDQLESAYARMKSGLEQTQDPRRRFALAPSWFCCGGFPANAKWVAAWRFLPQDAVLAPSGRFAVLRFRFHQRTLSSGLLQEGLSPS